jgi:DNA-binding MarR family transcriptional regulator
MAKKISFRFKSPEESPGYLLGQVTLVWQRKQKKVLDPLGLTQTQFVLLAALAWLSRDNDNVTQVDIANQGNADRMMVSKVLRTLEEKSFIVREEHASDTRAKTVKLTSKGEQVLQKALVAVENTDVEFFAALGRDLPAFNRNMVTLLDKNKEP